jgi:cyclomaltodextrinase / maltogenic alpha-amylase / neopullulanase
MKNAVLILMTIVMLGCSKKEAEVHLETSDIKGLATPIHLSEQNQEVLLSDYFLNLSQIDSVGKNPHYSFSLSADKSVLTIEQNQDAPHILNLRIWTGKTPNDIPMFRSERKSMQLIFSDKDKMHKEVGVKGEFSNWQILPMYFENGNWTHSAEVNPGIYQYVFVVDGKEQPDPSNPDRVSNGMGGFNSIVNLAENQHLKPIIKTLAIKENTFTFTASVPLGFTHIYHENYLLPIAHLQIIDGIYHVELPQSDLKRSHLRIYGANEYGSSNDILIPLEYGSIITDASKLDRTDFHSQVMYFLMVDRFYDGNPDNTRLVDNDSIHPKANYYGGDLEGVLKKLEDGYFTQLGINTIWLSPITQNPEGAYGLWPEPMTKFSGYHGYWPISNTKIDDRFGDDRVFEELIAAAHSRGINVLLDYVANHVHEEHPLYKENPHWATELYLPDGSLNTERWDDHRLTTWFDTFMPTLDFSQPEVVEKMSDSALYWVTRFELDGFRHDATKHIQEEFWRTLTRKIKEQTDRPIFQIGETYGSPELIRSYISTGMLDAQFDFNLYDASVQAFATDESFENLAANLEKSLLYYGHHHLMGTITGNQDRARFISYASGDVRFDEDAKKAGWTREIKMSDTTAYKKLAMLHAFNLFIPGIPCIYYGDEYGSIGGNDPDNRKMMQFENLNHHEAALKDKVTELVHLRRNSMALQYGSTEILQADKNSLIIKRSYFDETLIIVFNKSNSEMRFENKTIQPNNFKIIQ